MRPKASVSSWLLDTLSANHQLQDLVKPLSKMPQHTIPTTSLSPLDSLRQLPLEIIQQVLKSLPDVNSVPNASMSCRLFKDALRGHESDTLKAELYIELGDLHPEAIKALQIPVSNNISRDLDKLLLAMPV